MSTSQSHFILTFNTPLKSLSTQKEVKEVTVPSQRGQIQILPQHIALTCALKPGILSYIENQEQKKFAVSSGYAQLIQGHLRIVVEEVWISEEINKEECLKESKECLHLLAEGNLNKEDFAKTEIRYQKTQAQLHLLVGA